MLFYHLFLYPALLKILAILKKNKNNEYGLPENYPTITVLCPAYNEVDIIEEKIHSFLNLNYPADKIHMIVISDDSTDGTNEVVERYLDTNRISLVIQKPRQGKQAGHNLVRPTIKSDYVLSTDANSIFHPDSVIELVKTMLSSSDIGITTGEVLYIKNESGDSGESLYWKYEGYMKQLESDWYSIIGSNGPIFLIKTELFIDIPTDSCDDFLRALYVLFKHYKGRYNSKAKTFEMVTSRCISEMNRKTRIIGGQWVTVFTYAQLLNPFQYPQAAFMLFSHKILRWIFPIFIIGAFISNAFLLHNYFYLLLFILQLIVYILGFIELGIEQTGKTFRLGRFCGYLVSMNISAIIGFYDFITKSSKSVWEKERQ